MLLIEGLRGILSIFSRQPIRGLPGDELWTLNEFERLLQLPQLANHIPLWGCRVLFFHQGSVSVLANLTAWQRGAGILKL